VFGNRWRRQRPLRRKGVIDSCHTAPMVDDPGLLRTAADRAGNGPLAWIAAPLQPATLVLDVCCGPGALADEIADGRWLGVTCTAASGPTPRLRGTPDALPVRTNAVDGVAMLLALQRLPRLDDVFAELRRVLRPGGTLVLLVPSALARSASELRLASLTAAVHRHWRHRSALDRTGWLLAAADFAVLGDDRVSFSLPLPDAEAAHELVEALPRAGLWPPDLPADIRARATAGLTRLAGPGRVLPIPLRRLVARR
jgi:SAM-dependent methyltransferase